MLEFNKIYLGDCLEVMRNIPDKSIDLVLTDPPYGIGISKNPVRQMHAKKQWDNDIPNEEYFNEIFRISKNQIIWGGNYFNLPSSQGFIIWDKKQPENFSLAMCEYAYSSFQKPAKIYRRSVLEERGKVHPTQKPVALFKWILDKYSEEGQTILDPFAGSGTTAIACHDLKRNFICIEKEPEYHAIATKRYNEAKAQMTLF